MIIVVISILGLRKELLSSVYSGSGRRGGEDFFIREIEKVVNAKHVHIL